MTPTHWWIVLSAPFVALFATSQTLPSSEFSGRASADWFFAIGATLLVSTAAYFANSSQSAAAQVLLSAALCYLALFDIEHLAIPIWPVWVLTVLGFGWSFAVGGVKGLTTHCLASLAGYCILRGVAFVFRRLSGKEGLGEGDALILALIGAWLPWRDMAWVMVLAGALTLGWALLAKWPAGRPLPFAPGLAFGAYIMMLLGGQGALT